MSDVDSDVAPATPVELPAAGSSDLVDAAAGKKDGAEIYNTDPAGFEMIFDNNGWTREDFITRRQDFKILELFLMVAPNVPHVQHFPNLTTLRLMHISLNDMKVVEKLRHLQVLWLSENFIKKIEGLDSCDNLRELYLQSNCISKIEGLQHTRQLEVLWLCTNELTAIEGLEKLGKLRSLWLASNQISAISGALDGNALLNELNLSNNCISSFREIPPLNALTNLDRLWLSDATYGTNPVCSLCNYQTFTVFHLHNIHSLDGVAVGADQRGMAEATFVKKTMYYEMRVKTLRRNTRNLLAKAEELHTRKKDEISTSLEALERLQKDLQREIDEDAAYAEFFAGSNATFVAQLKTKLDAAANLVALRRRDLATMDGRFESLRQQLSSSAESQIARLMVELHTGGNVRLEEGKPKEVWHQSCSELLRTRFFPQDFETYGLKELRVTKVTRLHNRAMRMRFDRSLESLVDTTDPSYKRALEYLFYADTSTGFDDEAVNDAVEFGFRPEDFPNGVPLTNSVFLAEQKRLLRAFKAGELSGRGTNPYTLAGRVIVAKVFLGKAVQEKASPSPASNDPNAVVAGPSIDRSDYPKGTSSVYRARATDTRQRVWFCQIPEVVLPEYVVEFAYVPSGTLLQAPPAVEWGETRADEVTEVLTKLFPVASRVDIGDMRTVAPLFLSYVQWSNANASVSSRSDATGQLLAMPPTLPARDPLPAELAPEKVVDCILRTGARASAVTLLTPSSDLSSLQYVNLLGRGLFSLDVILPLPFGGLTTLSAAFNELPRIEANLAMACPLLTSLDLSHNHIKRIEHLDGLARLQTLALGHNLCYRLEDVALLAKNKGLKEVTLAGNPFATVRGFRGQVADLLPTLESLDGEALKGRPVVDAPWAITVPLLLWFAKQRQQPERRRTVASPNAAQGGPASLQTLPPAELRGTTGDASTLSVADDGLLAGLESLSLPNLLIQKMESLARCALLTALDLSGNRIVRIEGLHRCSQLQSLNLENNRLTSMDGLGALEQLRRLELSRNQISKIEGLEQCSKLSFLSLENNAVESMAPLAGLPAIAEAYLCNNRIANGKEVNLLRDLPKLIILDLSGNNCCTEELYRTYTVFQLKKLKVLDGVSIDAAETNLAKDTFAGRISAELLSERVAPNTPWPQATELSLSACALREVALLDAFAALQHLKLDHNALVDVSGLRACLAMVSLNLSFNKLAGCVVGRALEGMTRLESISLEANGISSIAALQLRLPRLKFLNLKGNEILRVDGLDGAPQLREILLDKNRLRAIDKDSFAQTPLLRELYVEENAIKTFEGCRLLPQLQKLSLASNRVTELADVERGLDGLHAMIEICLLGNSVVRKNMYRVHVIHLLPSVQIVDNREVTPEERERAVQLYQQDAQIPPNVFTDVRSPVVAQSVSILVPFPQPPSLQARSALRVMTLEGIVGDSTPSPAVVALGGPASGSLANGRVGRPPAQSAPSKARTGSADLNSALRPRPKPSVAIGIRGRLPGQR